MLHTYMARPVASVASIRKQPSGSGPHAANWQTPSISGAGPSLLNTLVVDSSHAPDSHAASKSARIGPKLIMADEAP